MGKSALASKTVWFNGLVLTAALLTTLINHELIANNPRVVGILTAASGFVGVVLRFLTTQPIES